SYIVILIALPSQDPYVIPSSEGIDGCPTFAKAYVGRKRWAKPNNCCHWVDWQIHITHPISMNTCDESVPKGRLKVAQDASPGLTINKRVQSRKGRLNTGARHSSRP